LVVWYDGRNTSHDIYGARVTPSGTVLDPSGIAISTAFNDQQFPSVTSDGNYHFVVWHDYRNGYPNIDIYGARVSNDGVVIDPSGIAIATATNEQMYPEIAFNGTNYLVVWSDERIDLQYYIYGARVTQSGTVLDPTGIAISNHGVYPKVASDGVNYLVGWDCDTDIYGARVSQSGTVLDPGGIVISIGTNYQWQPSVAFDGNNYLVVWEDERSGYFRDIYGLRIDQYGNCLDSSAIAISTATDMQRYVSVTFGGTNYLVVWEDERNYPDIDIYGARVTQSGTVLDPMGIHIAAVLIDENRPHPSVNFDGTNYLVVWEEATIYPYLDIYGVFVNQSGNVLGPSFCISNATDYQWHPSVVFDGTNYLVVWQDNRSGVTDIYGARVDQSGNILDPSGIAISTATSNQRRPSVTYDGTNYLVVWEDYRSGGCDIYGARVDQSGNVIDPAGIAISTAQDNQKYPVTSWDGTDYVIVWHDFRSYTEWDVYGAKVNTSGVIIDSFSVSLQLGDQISPSIGRPNFTGTCPWFR
jgi:phosphoribosylformylglycinamidine (FGAM) synthase PurS component